MTGESFEYEIKKDVRNNAIVREVDRERHREMWRTVLVGTFLVLVLVFSVWRHTVLITHGYEAGALESDIAALRTMNSKWRVEIEARRAPARIELIAKRDLGMVEPGPDDRSVIERVLPSPPPPRSVVARR